MPWFVPFIAACWRCPPAFLVAVLVFLCSAGQAIADCSVARGNIVINEYNLIPANTPTGVPYVELKIVDPQTLAIVQGGGNPFLQGSGTQEWTLTAYRSNGQNPVQVSSRALGTMYAGAASSSANNYCRDTTKLYVRVPFASNEIDDSSNVVLLDNYGNVVDVLRAAMKKSTTPVTRYAGLPACSTCERTNAGNPFCTASSTQLKYDTDYAAGNAADEKNIQRLPDGTGIWKEALGGGNNSEDSLCTTNDNILLVTKTASPMSYIAAGSNVTYTITVRNGSATTDMTNVVVEDIIPAGLNYVSNSAGSPAATYSVGILTWNVEALAKGASASITVTASVSNGSVAITNTATATSTQLAGAQTQGSATINALRVSIAPVTATVALNGTANYVVTVENLSPSAALYGVQVNISEPVGVSFPSGPVSWNVGTLTGGAVATYNLAATGTSAGTRSIVAAAVTTSYLGNSFLGSAALVVVNAPGAFSVIDGDASQSNFASGKIYTKLAGTAFSLKLAAMNGGVPDTAFAGDVTVQLLANTGTPGAGYGSDNCPTAASALLASPLAVTLSAGQATATGLAVIGAYRDVRAKVSFTGPPLVSSCSSDSFAIRPIAFTVSSTNAGNVAASGLPAMPAGGSFNLTASAVAGYGLTPAIDNSKVFGSPDPGWLAGSFAAANGATGVAVGDAFTYSEVGTFGLDINAVYDNAFTAIDQGSDCTDDFSNTLVGGKYGCRIGSLAVPLSLGSSGFGRFVPEHFDTAVLFSAGVPLACPGGLTCPAAYNGLVYSGQPFQVQVTARNAAGGTTRNYAAAYAQAVSLSAWDALGSTTTQNPAGTLANGAIGAAAFIDGVAATSTPVYTLTTVITGPTDVFMRADGADTVSSLRTPPVSSVEGGVKVATGRVQVSNAFGSDKLDLRLPAEVQYWTGNYWTTSLTDVGGSSLVSSSIYVSGTTTASTRVSWVPGGPWATSAAPPGRFGLTLRATAAEAVDLGFSVADWLKYPWDSCAVPAACVATDMKNPRAKASFGVYPGSNRIIYRREAR